MLGIEDNAAQKVATCIWYRGCGLSCGGLARLTAVSARSCSVLHNRFIRSTLKTQHDRSIWIYVAAAHVRVCLTRPAESAWGVVWFSSFARQTLPGGENRVPLVSIEPPCDAWLRVRRRFSAPCPRFIHFCEPEGGDVGADLRPPFQRCGGISCAARSC